jgi:hypothetical protein
MTVNILLHNGDLMPRKDCSLSIANYLQMNPTRIQNYSSTAIDNVFIDRSRKDHISVKPVINKLSEHGA